MYKTASRYLQHIARQREPQPIRREVHVIPKSIQRALALQRPVRGTVTALNRGGFEVRLNGVRAFCPHSMMYAAPTSETSRNGLVGQRLEFIVVEIKSRSVIVSRRAAMRKRSLERLRVAERSGEVLVGTVTNVLSYGAFIDLGGIEGLVHISEIADHWIENLHGILHSGMSVRVVVLQVDEQGERIALSMRQVLR